VATTRAYGLTPTPDESVRGYPVRERFHEGFNQWKKQLACSLLLTMTVLPLMAQVAAGRSEVSQTEEDKLAEAEVRRLNAEEGQAFLNKDPKTLDRLWSDDMVVTNPLNKFVTKQQVLRMVESGFLVIASFDRQIEYLRYKPRVRLSINLS
jgi:hypothetical protein